MRNHTPLNTARHAGYYEAIIQIRPKDPELFGYVGNLLREMKIGVAKVEDFKYGYDLYVVDKAQIGTVGRKMRATFGCKTEISRKLHHVDRQSSTFVYRVTLLCRREKHEAA